MSALYNEIEPYAADWLRNLVRGGYIARGKVDERSIRDLTPGDVRDAVQAHFFAGIGAWSYALRLAGWPDDEPVWTGSCPCQPFSSAGRHGGFFDERHLWPVWFHLIRECRPPVVFGEQVASTEVIGHQGEGGRVSTKLSSPSQGQGFSAPRATTSGGERSAVRSGAVCRRDSAEDRFRGVRGNRTSAESRWRSHLGQSLSGSDCPFCGVPVREHQDRLPCSEQRPRRLGGAEVRGHGAGDLGQEAREVERLIGAFGRGAAEESGGAWIDVVQADLESAGYSVGFAVLPAAGVGAPHIRQRLFFVAVADGQRLEGLRLHLRERGPLASVFEAGRSDEARIVGHPGGGGSGRNAGAVPRAQGEGGRERRAARGVADEPVAAGAVGLMGDAQLHGCGRDAFAGGTGTSENDRRLQQLEGPNALSGPWADAEWIPCRDGKWRPVEPGTFPLAHGAPARVGRLRAYGNAIVPEVAATFIRAARECFECFGDRRA